MRIETPKEWLSIYFYYRKSDPGSIHERRARGGLYQYFD
jgi:hypothetical protein